MDRDVKLVFDAKEWNGRDVGDNSQFWHPAEVISVDYSDYHGARIATVRFKHDGRVSRGHFYDQMREVQ